MGPSCLHLVLEGLDAQLAQQHGAARGDSLPVGQDPEILDRRGAC